MSSTDQEKEATTAVEPTPQTLNQSNKKRKTDNQLTKDNYEEDDRFGPSELANDVERADDETLKQRKIVKAGRRKGKSDQETVPDNGSTTNGKEDKPVGFVFNFATPSDLTTTTSIGTPEKKELNISNNISVTTPFKFDFSFSAPQTGTETSGFGNFGTVKGFGFGDLSNQQKDLEWKGSDKYEPTEESGGDNPEQFEASFTPQQKVQLSDEPVKSGEEEDKTICTFKAKLYRLTKVEKEEGEDKTTTQEWKEAGVGQLKVNELKNGRGRIIMRAEPTLRLVLNALIFSSITFKKNGDKQVIFSVFDEKLEIQSYLAKFQKAEQSAEFIKTIELYKSKAQ